MRNVAFLLGLLLFSCTQSQPEVASSTQPDTAKSAKMAKATKDEAGELPCSVATVLRAKCQHCHGHPTTNTAPMSLTSWDELHAEAPTRRDLPAAKVFERIASRLHDRLRPMPPRDQPQLSELELLVLDEWLDDGAESGPACTKQDDAPDAAPSGNPEVMTSAADAGVKKPEREQPKKTAAKDSDAATSDHAEPMQPSADAGQQPTDAGMPATGAAQTVDPSECDYVEVRAQQDAMGTAYDVPADATDLYQCFLIDLAFDAPRQGLSFEHLADNKTVVHHWMLRSLGESDRKPGTLITCDDLYPTNRLVASWSPGHEDWYLPKDVGIDLGRGLFILEIHYNNIGQPATTDRTGVRVCTAKQPRQNTAATSWLGNQLFSIPPRSSEYPISSRCKPTHQTDPIQLLQVTPHMHLHGVRATMRIDHADGTSQMLFDEPFAFGSEKSYRNLGALAVGDSLVSTCYYDNPDNTALRMGVKTTDEMCHFFVAAYPAHQLINEFFSVENDTCLGPE